MTTQFFGFGNGRFGHPDQDRAISLREGAILQTTLGTYKFVAKGDQVYFKSIGRLIGNAVPVKLGKAIGKSIIRHIQNAAEAPPKRVVYVYRLRNRSSATTAMLAPPEPGQLGGGAPSGNGSSPTC